MRNPGTVFLYYWTKATYSDAQICATFFAENDTKNHLGFWPLTDINHLSPSTAYFTPNLETDYFIVGLRALSHKILLKHHITPPSGIGIYLGMIDALKNFEPSDEDTKDSIKNRLFEYAETWKVGLALGSLQLSPSEQTHLSLLCSLLAEKMTALPCKKDLIEEIVCLGSPTACIQIDNLNPRKMRLYFEISKQLQDEKKLSWSSKAKQNEAFEHHNAASIVFELLKAGGISHYPKKYKIPGGTLFQALTLTPDKLYAIAKQAAAEEQNCRCSMM